LGLTVSNVFECSFVRLTNDAGIETMAISNQAKSSSVQITLQDDKKWFDGTHTFQKKHKKK
jgi:hypothetical protein